MKQPFNVTNGYVDSMKHVLDILLVALIICHFLLQQSCSSAWGGNNTTRGVKLSCFEKLNSDGAIEWFLTSSTIWNQCSPGCADVQPKHIIPPRWKSDILIEGNEFYCDGYMCYLFTCFFFNLVNYCNVNLFLKFINKADWSLSSATVLLSLCRT